MQLPSMCAIFQDPSLRKEQAHFPPAQDLVILKIWEIPDLPVPGVAGSSPSNSLHLQCDVNETILPDDKKGKPKRGTEIR